MTKAKKTYKEKLLDPRWQRKRLEALARANFSCSLCGDEQSTLHVHHHQYITGREPWEYEAEQLSVLCKSCHKSQHEEEDALELVSSFATFEGSRDRPTCASVLAGFLGLPMENKYVFDPYAYVLGSMAGKLSNTSIDLVAIHEWTCSDKPELEKLAEILSQKRVQQL